MKKPAIIAAILVVAGLAAAGALTVTQRNDTVNVFAERVTLSELFAVGESTLLPALAAQAAAGTEGSPVELAPTLPAARTALARDSWVYTVRVAEVTTGAVATGTFTLRLLVDNVAKGTIFVTQASPETTLAEGVMASFDVGPALSTDALYFVEVKPFTSATATVPFTVRSNPNGNLSWLGVGGAIDAAWNPELVVPLGSMLQLTGVNADGGLHDIGLRDASNALIDPPGWSPDFAALGEQGTISWTPSAAGTYSYLCKYHPTTMTGTVRVTSA